MVREGPEGLVAEGNLGTEPPGSLRVKDAGRRDGHDLVDPAESVDGDFLHEQVFDLLDLVGRRRVQLGVNRVHGASLLLFCPFSSGVATLGTLHLWPAP